MSADHEALAIALQQLGNALMIQRKPLEAVDCYRRLLTLKPEFAEAHYNLGNALFALGRLSDAVACYRQSLEFKPSLAAAHTNLGHALKSLGSLDDAVDCYRRALVLRPNDATSFSNLGNVLKAQGKLDDAIDCYRRALTLKPDHFEAFNNLGNALHRQNQLAEAVSCYRHALELKPDNPLTQSNLGVALHDQTKLDEAVACHERAIKLKPDFAEAHCNLGNTFKCQGKLNDAVASYRRALELKPDYFEAHSNLGDLLLILWNLDEAAECFQRAFALKPDFAEANNNLGNAFKEQGKLDLAAASYRRALQLDPEYAPAHCNLGVVMQSQGRLDDAIASYRRALQLKPDYALAHSNLLLSLQYRFGMTLSELAEAHDEFDQLHAVPLRNLAEYVFTQEHDINQLTSTRQEGSTPAAPLSQNVYRSHGSTKELPVQIAERPSTSTLGRRLLNNSDALLRNDCDRRQHLRLGFISADFGRHPVGYFLVKVLENLRQEPLELICYSDRVKRDDLTDRIQTSASCWRDVTGMSDDVLAKQIRTDGIDILFDLSGHTAGNRMLVFARKPAAIQVTWAGYAGTTGLKAMDYILADRYQIPLEAERYYRERVVRMPDGYICYDPPVYAPPVKPLPALTSGGVTFGCFNNPAKITQPTIDVWAKIFDRLPHARLVLKYRGWNDNSAAQCFIEKFTPAIDPGRIDFLGHSPHADLLAEYQRIDLALDPFPYSGGLTTCEALWMGIPVITCPGETFASRHSLSHLSNVGLTETIARNFDEYVELAVSLAIDLQRLAMLRAGLRKRMADSPLCDGKRFVANFVAMLNDVSSRSQH